MGRFRKQNKMQLPIQILVHLRLLFKRNGIKCPNSLQAFNSSRKRVDKIIKKKKKQKKKKTRPY